ncbi:alpha-2-macroglobulin family protein [Cellvibrio mixtus]|uniref:alpha-2-macroglobulin family protein n=1 Tax=Cellvibrio mixtus TaxID=39650 RepID=UPI000586ED81|nr:MG2 domain-containing protein [Cellvibrio mixtus]
MRVHWYSWCVLVLLGVLLGGCGKSPDGKKDSSAENAGQIAPDWEAHIADYPKRWVAAEAPMYIRFTHPVVNDDQVNTAFNSNLVALDNKTPVNLTFTSTTDLRIQPASRLPSDTAIRVRLSPKGLQGIEQSLDDFEFEVHTIKQDFDLKVNSLSVMTDNEEQMQLSGSITTADTAELDAVKKLLTLKVNSAATDLVWTQELDKKTHNFLLTGINRTDTTGNIHLEWDGAAIGSVDKGARDLEIPAKKVFQVTGVQVIREPNAAIEIQFSDELDQNQNLSGLITLGGKAVKAVVDGSVIRHTLEQSATGELELVVNAAIASGKRKTLASEYKHQVVLELVKPLVRFVGKTSILPPASQISVPFEAAGVDSVQVIAFKVYANNIGQYLQDYQLTAAYPATDTGRYLWRKTYRLPEIPRAGVQRFNLDLTELMAQHPDGLIRLELRIDRSNSVYTCDQPRPTEPVSKMPEDSDGEGYYEREQEPAWYQQYYQSQGYYNYSERNNPCDDTYYYYGDDISTARNFIVSNIGLTAKRADGNELHVISTELNSAKPLSGTEITAFNYQRQPIGNGKTDNYGMLQLITDGVPFYLEAKHGKQVGYLRVRSNEALPTNQFDVSGEHIKGGLKGFLYGERDVWRPGDDIFLTFILEDKSQQLPANHPVTLDLFDPSGKKVVSQTSTQPVNDFYTFTLKTEETAPTGNYRAVVHVGNRYFDQLLKIEMVVPNRLKVDLTPEETPLRVGNMPTKVSLFSQWLQGATAKNLKTDSELKLFTRKSVFAGFEQFNFDDPVRTFSGSTQKVFDGNVDATGHAEFTVDVSLSSPPPGKLTASFTTRVFEDSGNFSTILRPYELLPFDHWVGINIAKGSGYMDSIGRDKDHPVLFQTLGADGKAEANRNVEVNVYEIGWRWWWDEEQENLAEYFNNSSRTPVHTEKLVSDANGRINWKLEKEKYDWGRHIIRVCDTDAGDAGHCAGEVVYLGWSYDSSAQSDSATQLMLSTDKEKYAVGDIAKVRLPKAREGRILLSLENGTRVLESRWLDLQPGQTEIEIPITQAMAPNIYANVMLLLPHQDRVAEAPMRLYGIVPLLVENPQTRLQPTLDVAEKVRPETEFIIKVGEQNKRAMTYTLAMVDEGLLGLTNFHVPDAHSYFYKREALGVRTWDLFDQVVGAYGASLERVLAVGGSDAALEAERKRRERRFPPVVQFLGAFELKAGEVREHKIKLPPYMGSVRVMVVAGDTASNAKKEEAVSAYGNVEKTVTVTQPVTLFATLPRVLGPGESVNLPVNVFVSEANIKNVDISLEANEIFTVEKGSTQLQFSEPGDAIASLKLKVNDRIGKSRVKVTARSGDEVAMQEIFIDSRAANPPTTVWESKLLQPGETWQSPLTTNGMVGTNVASLEVSTLPSLNLDQRLEYLIGYPHGCIEQTTSAVFPQLRLAKLVNLTDVQKAEIDNNIAAGIKRLTSFQHASGGFSYWPGDGYVNEWASSYAGHFLLEAKRAGYSVPKNLLDNWVKYQSSAARNPQIAGNYYDEVVLAYRLYTLALADKAELPAMNRLRETFKTQSNSAQADYRMPARWLLAMSYQHVGLKDAAQDVLGPLSNTVPTYKDAGYTYGSDMRDRGLLLATLVTINANKDLTWQVAEQVAKDLSSGDWYSTQSIAWALLAMSEFAAANTSSSDIKFAVQQQGEKDWVTHGSNKTIFKMAINNPQVSVRNDHDVPIRVLVSNRGIPANLQEEPGGNGLNLSVNFLTLDNKPLSVEQLPQGQDFVAEVTVQGEFDKLLTSNIENIALTAVVPSGWQIRNERLEGAQMPKGIDYIDFRDDRVLAYYSLWRDYYWNYRYQDRNQTSITLRIILNASYAGKFYLPGWHTSAMYNEKIYAKSKGYWVEVVAK